MRFDTPQAREKQERLFCVREKKRVLVPQIKFRFDEESVNPYREQG